MAEETRKQLNERIRQFADRQGFLERENAQLREEVQYAHRSVDREKAVSRQLSRDRDRLTATVEDLARRLASEGVNQLSEAPSRERIIGGIGASDPTAKYPRH